MLLNSLAVHFYSIWTLSMINRVFKGSLIILNYFQYSIHIDYGMVENKTAPVVWSMVEFGF